MTTGQQKKVPMVKKIPLDAVKDQAVIRLLDSRKVYEIAVGLHYYELSPLPGGTYGQFMAIMRRIWYHLLAEKENQFAEAVQSAKALAQNMKEIDDKDTLGAARDLMTKLTESRKVHPLEFLSHPQFATEIDDLLNLLLEGCDPEDREILGADQLARILEIALVQNFLPFVRLAEAAGRIFREEAS